MIDWLVQNKEWLFSGIGVVVLGIVAKLFRNRRLGDSSPQQVIIHTKDDPQASSVKLSNGSLANNVVVKSKRIAAVSATDIRNAIEETVPLHQASVKQRFVGLIIEWDTYLESANVKDEEVRLFLLASEEPHFFILCSVKYDDYRELGILPRESLIRVQGEIVKAEDFSVHLENVELKSMEARRR